MTAIDLLERMLEVDADKRITAEETLAHPYLAEVYTYSSQITLFSSLFPLRPIWVSRLKRYISYLTFSSLLSASYSMSIISMRTPQTSPILKYTTKHLKTMNSQFRIGKVKTTKYSLMKTLNNLFSDKIWNEIKSFNSMQNNHNHCEL